MNYSLDWTVNMVYTLRSMQIGNHLQKTLTSPNETSQNSVILYNNTELFACTWFQVCFMMVLF